MEHAATAHATTSPVLKLKLPNLLPKPGDEKPTPFWENVTAANGNSAADVDQAKKVQFIHHRSLLPNGCEIYISTPGGDYTPNSVPERFRYDCQNHILGYKGNEFLIPASSLWDVLHDNSLASTILANEPIVRPGTLGKVIQRQSDDKGQSIFAMNKRAWQNVQKDDILVFWREIGTQQEPIIQPVHAIKIVETKWDDELLSGETSVMTKNGCEDVKVDTLNGVFNAYQGPPWKFHEEYLDDDRNRWAGVYRLQH